MKTHALISIKINIFSIASFYSNSLVESVLDIFKAVFILSKLLLF
jgi:hypothetical protein